MTARLRADAERNRQRIIDAARRVFAARGVHAPVEDIAKEAGVGIGTLYRRFPDRTELVEAVFLERAGRYLAAAEQARLIDDPWEAFRSYLEQLCAIQAEDATVTDVLTLTLPASGALETLRNRLYATQNRLIRAAKRQGTLRADFVPEDVPLLLIANAAIIQTLGDAVPTSAPRFLALALDALRTDHPSPLPAPPDPAALVAAMQRPPVKRRGPS
ncbi:DNA-binding transcriptional regulator, AcrR family [Asanoa hainanensis]|uniref:DNA-binding transcriptional regulator, AcrR family n=1 Tax=Asanoa hainanensis TaxID=560556 RepID=A0A239MT49_9ACTN|nr:TetR family transcriptional regulator [Asanoa hainanensis]SNT45911.1 DNA-binding transcriptional regulator, AcrR family [Asanoa hainanensis]